MGLATAIEDSLEEVIVHDFCEGNKGPGDLVRSLNQCRKSGKWYSHNRSQQQHELMRTETPPSAILLEKVAHMSTYLINENYLGMYSKSTETPVFEGVLMSGKIAANTFSHHDGQNDPYAAKRWVETHEICLLLKGSNELMTASSTTIIRKVPR